MIIRNSPTGADGCSMMIIVVNAGEKREACDPKNSINPTTKQHSRFEQNNMCDKSRLIPVVR